MQNNLFSPQLAKVAAVSKLRSYPLIAVRLSVGKMSLFNNGKKFTISVERARVLFSYSAENEDELNIDEGEIITILDKELEDSGWWKGEINGKIGVFPDNFVELLPPEEPHVSNILTRFERNTPYSS